MPLTSLSWPRFALLALLLTSACADTGPESGGGEGDGGRERDLSGNDDIADGGDAEDAADTGVGDGADDGDAADTGSPNDGGPSREGGVLADPESIFLSSAGVGTLQEQLVNVWNESDQDIVFHSVEIVSSAAGFNVRGTPTEAERTPGQAIGFVVQYTAQVDAPVSADVLVHHSLSDDPLIIPVSVASKVEDGGCLSVLPTSLDFGTVIRGRSGPVTRTFNVTNCGTPDVTLLRLDRARILFLPTPSAFQWSAPSPLPLVLAGGESTTVTVVFTADRAGDQRGGIDVVANVDGAETTRVSLRATTEPPPLSELDLHLRLRWDVSGGSDVDFHFYPQGADLFSCDDCFYSNLSPDWGVAGDIVDDPFLDYDDLEGPGPENVNVDELPDGSYVIAVHYYSDTGSGGGGDFGSSTEANATVEVFIGGTLTATYGPQNLAGTDVTWNVARIDWPSAALTPLGTVFTVNRGDYSWCTSGGFGF